MKKILSIILTFTIMLCLVAVPVSVSASTEYTAGLYTYTVDSNGNATITDVDTSITGLSGKVTVPSTLGGYPVTIIGDNAYNGCINITNVTIPNSIKSIGSNAFDNCTNIISVTIPDSVTSIGGSAFNGCTSLTYISIPDSVTSIGASAFTNTAFYNDSNNWQDDVLYIDNHLIVTSRLISNCTIRPGTRTLAVGAFWGCSSLTSITIPDSVAYIEGLAFYRCTNLENVILSGSVKSIEPSTFSECTSLKNFTIPDSVTSIGMYAFSGCTSLTNLTIPDSVTSIGGGAFSMCTSLKTVYYSGSEEEWNNINVLSNNDELISAKIIYAIKPSEPIEITNSTSTDTTLKFISEVHPETGVSTFGTTFIPLWLFEIGDTNVATVEYDNSKYNIQDGQTFGATLTGIPESYKDVPIVGKSYLKDADGNYTWSSSKYTSVNDTTLVELDY